MQTFLRALALSWCAASAAAEPGAPDPPAASVPPQLSLEARAGGQALVLTGPDSGQQLLATASRPGNRFSETDATRQASFSAEPAGVVDVDAQGWMRPVGDGEALVTARFDGASATLAVRVEAHSAEQPVSFPNDVVPVFTRHGCNEGACHAKTTDHNGFHLSLFGYDPAQDHEMLALASRGRRLTPSAPGHSLLLLKATGEIPHGGGARLAKDSPDYRLLARWIAGGTAYGPENDPSVERIEIVPAERIAAPEGSQQLVVTAFFDDGTTRDITRAVQYEAQESERAAVDGAGLVRFGREPGSTSVLARFQEHVAVFAATIPLGDPIEDLPPPANFIDEEIFGKLGLLGLPPSAPSGDATFLRRVTLDIAGRLPTVDETRDFLASADPEKRARRVDALLETAEYADHFAGKWTGLLRNKAQGNLDWVSRDTYGFHEWLRSALLEDRPFGEVAAALVTASGKTGENPAASWYRAVTDTKERMQDIAQVFLGVRMQCAQCHHHPYEKWSQHDYYRFAAFFSTVARKEVYRLPEDDIIHHNRQTAEMKHPGTGEMLKPAVLGGPPLEIPAEADPRRELAAWLSSPDNPFFARALVNRYWKHFFSRGLVEPEDDIRPTNPATHPRLLERLAARFAESGGSTKELVRAICNSRAYQLSSEPNEANAADIQNFARYYPKRLPAEALLDAFNDLTGAENSFARLPLGVRAIALPDDSANRQSEFLTLFGRPQMDTACECERASEANLGQSLHLINSDLIQAKLSTAGGRADFLARAADRSDEARVRELYLAALSREPDPGELSLAREHLEKKRAASAADPEGLPPALADREAFEDLIWVLSNTKEFLFNH